LKTFFIFFLIIIPFIQLGIDLYFLRFVKKYARKFNWSPSYVKFYKIATWFFFILSLSANSFRTFADLEYNNILIIIYAILAVWYFSKIILLPFYLGFDILKILKKMSNIILNKIFKKNNFKNKKIEEKTTNISRRNFLEGAGIITSGAPFLILANSTMNTVRNVRIIPVTVPVNNLPNGFDGFTIAQISDIHFGSFYNNSILNRTISLIDSLNPDILTITGDFVNFNPKEMEDFYPEFKKFKARKGVFACLGNHDHYMNAKDHDDLNGLISSKSRILNNENIILENHGDYLNLGGVDNSSKGQNFADFLSIINQKDPMLNTVLLCHNPKNWNEHIKSKTDIDLTLSGHTHGGQMAIESFGLKISPAALIYKQWAGLYSAGDQHLYVNRGLGTVGPPMRIGIPPEITLITLKKANNTA
jgi:uncharacterized protein